MSSLRAGTTFLPSPIFSTRATCTAWPIPGDHSSWSPNHTCIFSEHFMLWRLVHKGYGLCTDAFTVVLICILVVSGVSSVRSHISSSSLYWLLPPHPQFLKFSHHFLVPPNPLPVFTLPILELWPTVWALSLPWTGLRQREDLLTAFFFLRCGGR